MSRPTAHRWFAVLVAIAFAVLPWVTLGFVTWLAFGIAAALSRSRLLAIAAGGYAVAFLTLLITHDSPDGSLGEGLFTTSIIALWVVGGLHAVLASPALARALRRRWGPPAPTDEGILSLLSAEQRAELANDPALRRAVSRRERRRLAREIVASAPALADELGIGRPDLGTGFDDGGLVDINSAPGSVLTRLPGLDPGMADRVLAARRRHGPLAASDELVVYADLPPRLVARIRDRLIFRSDRS